MWKVWRPSLISFQRYWQFVIWCNLGMSCHTWPHPTKSISNFYWCLNVWKILRQSLNSFKICWQFVIWSILALVLQLWACLDMPQHTQQKLQMHFEASIDGWLYENCSNSHSSLSRDIDNLLFQSNLDMPGHEWLQPTKMTWSIFSFDECLTTCKKITQSLYPFLKYCSLKYPAIWFDESILSFSSRTKTLPDMAFMLEKQ